MKIVVTTEHINRGKRSNGSRCPIALAIREQFSKGKDILVNNSAIFVLDKVSDYRRYKSVNTPAVKEFIEKFDKKEKVEPLEFELNLKRMPQPARLLE